MLILIQFAHDLSNCDEATSHLFCSDKTIIQSSWSRCFDLFVNTTSNTVCQKEQQKCISPCKYNQSKTYLLTPDRFANTDLKNCITPTTIKFSNNKSSLEQCSVQSGTELYTFDTSSVNTSADSFQNDIGEC